LGERSQHGSESLRLLGDAPPSQLLHGQRRQTSLAHEAGVLGQANRLELADGDGGQRQSGECD
jgi:hypothetical protein